MIRVHDVKDVMLALLGGGVSLGGLLLVFCGFIFAQAQAMPPQTSNEILKRYRRVARFGLVPLAGALFVAGASACYFVWANHVLASVTLSVFLLLLLVTVAYGVAATRYL